MMTPTPSQQILQGCGYAVRKAYRDHPHHFAHLLTVMLTWFTTHPVPVMVRGTAYCRFCLDTHDLPLPQWQINTELTFKTFEYLRNQSIEEFKPLMRMVGAVDITHLIDMLTQEAMQQPIEYRQLSLL